MGIAFWGFCSSRRKESSVDNRFAISIRNLTKSYGRVAALKGIDLDVERGEVFGLLGPNGAGKTTLIEILEGLRAADGGEISVLGFDPGRELDDIKERIGIQLQSSSFYRRLTVVEVMRQFQNYYRKRADLEQLLETVALNEKRNSYVSELSGGQKQRLALALALVNDPEIVFLDEPTSGLDAQVRRQLWQAIEQMKRSGKTILLTTHYIEEAERLCDRVCIIDEGRKVKLDTPSKMIAGSRARSARVRLTTLKPLSLAQINSVSPIESSVNGNATYVLQVDNTGRAIVDLVGAIETQANELLELQITRATLEDVFLELTGKEIGR